MGADLPHDPMRRADPGVRVELTRPRLAELIRRGVWDPDPAVEQLFVGAGRLGPATGPDVVVHGDLHPRHLLVDDTGQAAGVIDWGDVCLADPAVDLSVAYSIFAGPARAALLSAYGGIDPECAVRARVLAVSLAAALADYAAAEGRDVLLREALTALGRAVT